MFRMFVFWNGVMDRVILHSDLNNFYASVECRRRPNLAGLPVAVSGDPELRHGIVLAKNNLAKACGVKTGEVRWQAQKKCPNIVFVPADFELYKKVSAQVREIYGRYTDRVESFGIDECWLDVTASVKLLGSGRSIADDIRQAIKKEVGITASVGVSFNKIYAKLASDYKKPDATTVIDGHNYKDIVFGLPADRLLYVGRKTCQKLQKYNIRTIGDIALADRALLTKVLGKWGEHLYAFAAGLDNSPVSLDTESAEAKSVGNSSTTPRDLTDAGEVEKIITVLAESVAARLREQGFKGNVVSVGLQDCDFNDWSRQTTLSNPTSLSGRIIKIAMALVGKYDYKKPVRNVSVKVSGLTREQGSCEQMSLFGESFDSRRDETRERVIDGIRDKFGHSIISRAVVCTDKELTGLNPKEDNVIHPNNYFK